MPSRDYLTSKLLIAMPNMGDPRFERSVVLICSHDDDHAMGVIVNKPLDDLDKEELLEDLGVMENDPSPDWTVYFGGPVHTGRGLVIHSLDYELSSTIRIGQNLGLTVSKQILIDAAKQDPGSPGPSSFMLAIGSAGWGPGQLEAEIAANSWAHCDARSDIIFDLDNDAAWRKAFGEIGVTGAQFSAAWSTARDGNAYLN